MNKQLILKKSYTIAVDYWSLGILLYEMLIGYTPFEGEFLYELIVQGDFEVPRFVSTIATDLIRKLIVLQPDARLGVRNNGESTKKHPFFKSIDWSKLRNKELMPAFKPIIDKLNPLRNFDEEYVKEGIDMTPADKTIISNIGQRTFKDFSYTNLRLE